MTAYLSALLDALTRMAFILGGAFILIVILEGLFTDPDPSDDDDPDDPPRGGFHA